MQITFVFINWYVSESMHYNSKNWLHMTSFFKLPGGHCKIIAFFSREYLPVMKLLQIFSVSIGQKYFVLETYFTKSGLVSI